VKQGQSRFVVIDLDQVNFTIPPKTRERLDNLNSALTPTASAVVRVRR
jgi:predicted DNA-binding protein